MARFIRKANNDVGISPDDLIFTGVHRFDDQRFELFEYDTENLHEREIESIQQFEARETSNSVIWLNITGISDKEKMAALGKHLELDSLMIPDVMDVTARPKIQVYPDATFISMKMMKLDEEDLIQVENICLILKDNMLISFQEIPGDVFDPIRERIRVGKKRMRSSGVEYLAYALMDIVIDNYQRIISLLGSDIEDLEGQIMSSQDEEILEEITYYKKELNFYRKTVIPAREVISVIAKEENELILKKNLVHFRDLLSDISNVIEVTDSYREIISDQLNIYHTLISGKLNDRMKLLTIISTIFIPITFLAGVYGMNMKYIPENTFDNAYPIFWAVCLVIAGSMIIYFKRNKWL